MIKEIYNKEADTFIEYPVDKAVTALNKAGIFTTSSGFHSHFDERRFGLKPCWCILVAGRIKKEIKDITEAHQLKVIEVCPVKGLNKWLITIIYLPWEIAIERNARKAKNIFEKFASAIERIESRIEIRKHDPKKLF